MQVEGPDGVPVDFPDGTPDEVVKQAFEKYGAKSNKEDDSIGNSPYLRYPALAAQAAVNGVGDLGNFAIGAANLANKYTAKYLPNELTRPMNQLGNENYVPPETNDIPSIPRLNMINPKSGTMEPIVSGGLEGLSSALTAGLPGLVKGGPAAYNALREGLAYGAAPGVAASTAEEATKDEPANSYAPPVAAVAASLIDHHMLDPTKLMSNLGSIAQMFGHGYMGEVAAHLVNHYLPHLLGGPIDPMLGATAAVLGPNAPQIVKSLSRPAALGAVSSSSAEDQAKKKDKKNSISSNSQE